MMKKSISALLLVCMIVSLVFGTALTSNAVYSDGAADSTEIIETKKGTRFVEQANLHINANKNAGLEGNIKVSLSKTGISGTIYLPGTANPDELFLSWDDSFTVTKNKRLYANGTAPIAAVGESVEYSISNGKKTVIVTIKTMKGSSDVSSMFLNLDESKGTIADMNADETHETSCYGSVDFEGENYPYMSMKGRGNSSWGFDKKPYNLTFYKKADYNKKNSVSLIDGVKAKKWSLLANYLDNSLMRYKVGLDLANDLGIGLDSKFVDLWMNGEYLGTYLLTPKNDYQAPDNGYMLENDNYISTDPEEPQFKMDGMKELGPYLRENNGYYNRITVKDIGDGAVEAGQTGETIEEWFSSAWAAVRDYDSEEYQKYFDVDTWTKMYLMYEVAKTYDAFSGSILMHRDGLTDDDKLIAGPVWDLDTCFGRTMYKFLVGITLPTQLSADGWYIDSIGLTADSAPVSLLQELGKHESFMKRMSEVYNEYSWAFENIAPNIDAQQAILSDSAAMNNDVWGLHHLGVYFAPIPVTIGTGKYQIHYKVTDSWDAYVENFREYASKRVMYLSDHFYAEAPQGVISGKTAVNAGDTLSLFADLSAGKSASTYQWQSSNDGKTWTDIDGAITPTYEKNVTLADNGMQYRCVVKNGGVNIVTIRGGKVQASAQTILEPVQITVAPAEVVVETPVIPDSPTIVENPTTPVDNDTITSNDETQSNTITATDLTNGKLTLALDGKTVGDFVFTSVDDGWTICNEDGKYLALDGKNLTTSDEKFVWQYENGTFSATTQVYLTSLGKLLGKSHTITANLAIIGNKLTASTIKASQSTFSIPTV